MKYRVEIDCLGKCSPEEVMKELTSFIGGIGKDDVSITNGIVTIGQSDYAGKYECEIRTLIDKHIESDAPRFGMVRLRPITK